jgi:CMP/dCMP kinase
MGLRYVDTGAMYRAMTWWVLEHGIDPGDGEAVALRCSEPSIQISTDPLDPRIYVDGVDVSSAIREPRVTEAVSVVSAVPQVRERLMERQRAERASAESDGIGIVMEGRDIGTVILPDADLKVFLTADSRVRAQRRAAEEALREGVTSPAVADADSTEESLRKRDVLDSTRPISPLLPASDAVHLDGSGLTLDEVVDHVVNLAISTQGHHA